jgi:hypothetical protein
VVGAPANLRTLIAEGRGDLLPGVRWAGAVRRWLRTFRRTLLEVDLAVKIITPILFVVIFASTLIFRYGLDSDWADGFYQTVTIVSTGSELHGEGRDGWIKVFLSVLKLAGAALVAGSAPGSAARSKSAACPTAATSSSAGSAMSATAASRNSSPSTNASWPST